MLFETRRHPDTHNGGFSHGPPRFSPYPRRFVLLVLVFLPVVSPKEVAAAATSCGPSLSPTDFAAVAETANNSIVLCGFFFLHSTIHGRNKGTICETPQSVEFDLSNASRPQQQKGEQQQVRQLNRGTGLGAR